METHVEVGDGLDDLSAGHRTIIIHKAPIFLFLSLERGINQNPRPYPGESVSSRVKFVHEGSSSLGDLRVNILAINLRNLSPQLT